MSKVTVVLTMTYDTSDTDLGDSLWNCEVELCDRGVDWVEEWIDEDGTSWTATSEEFINRFERSQQ